MLSGQAPSPFSSTKVSKIITYRETPLASASNVVYNSSPTFSLIFVVDRTNRKILLGEKKRGFGMGIINGYGGKLDPGETMDECARRELFEESGLSFTPEEMIKTGRIIFTLPNSGKPPAIVDIAVYVCFADSLTTQADDTEEMTPSWYDIDHELPLDKMWPDFQLYWSVLYDLFFNDDNHNQQLLARIDYDLVPSSYESPVPSLHALGIVDHKRLGSVVEHEEVEAVVGWWLALAAK